MPDTETVDLVLEEFGGRRSYRTDVERQMATEIIRLRQRAISHLNRWLSHLSDCEIRRAGGTHCSCGLSAAWIGTNPDSDHD